MLLGAVLQLILANNSYAESNLSGIDERHDTVVVKASRVSADHIDTNFQTGRVTVLQGADFESDVSTVADILRNETGLQIRQIGGLGSYTAISVRGSTGGQVNVYLDGVLLNDAYGGSVDLSDYLLESVERIEIYRGNVPVQLGIGGIGGAINIVSKRSYGAPSSSITVGYGSFNGRKLGLSTTRNIDQWSVLGSAEYLAADNDFEIVNENGTPNNPSDDRLENRQNNGFDQAQVYAALSKDLNEQLNVEYSLRHADKTNELPDLFNQPTTNTSLQNVDTTIQAKLNQELNAQQALVYELSLARNYVRYDDPQSRIGLNANRNEYETFTPKASIDYRHAFAEHLINTKLAVTHENLATTDLLNNIEHDYKRTRLSVGLQDEYLFANDAWLIANYHLDYLYDESSESNISTSNTVQSYGVGVKKVLSNAWSVFSNISHNIRTPTLSELYGDRGFSDGNPDLKPETAVNSDFGLDFDAKTVSATAAAFYRDLDDAIVVIYDSRGVGQSENRSKARIKGLEFELDVRPADDLLLGVKLTEQRTEDRSQNVTFKGSPLPNMFEHQYSTYAQYQWANFTPKLEYVYESDAYYAPSRIAPIKDVKLLNFRLGWAVKVHQVVLNVKNILNKETEYFNGFPGPGREAFITYKYTF